MLSLLALNVQNTLAGEEPVGAPCAPAKSPIAHFGLSLAFSGTDDYACP
jgi:hypothetical protein